MVMTMHFIHSTIKLKTFVMQLWHIIMERPLECGAIKEYSPDTAEVKRMYVNNDVREVKESEKILNELELWAKVGYKYTIMETGKDSRQQLHYTHGATKLFLITGSMKK
jgi:hypothetical protein